MKQLFTKTLLIVVLITLPLFLSVLTAHAAPSPEFEKTKVVGGLNDPTAMRFAPNGDIYVAEQAGAIKIIRNGTQLSTPVITVDTINDHEKGLLGIELDKNFATNGYLYASYTHSSGFARLSRFTVVNDIANPATEVIFFQSDQEANIYHNANDIHYGPDGKIWWSIGDNLATGNSQSLQSIHGKIARFDLDGTSANDNPWHGDGDKVDEVYALGLRNPFRFTFLPNGKAIVGDVGGALWEEINIITPGANYGWPQYEGECGSCGYSNPVFAYPHNGLNSSISALAVYTGTAFPPEYQGAVFYGDYARGIIRYLKFDENYQTVLSDNAFDDAAGTITDLHMGPDGALYYTDIFGSSIYKIALSGGNRAPIVKASSNPIAGLSPLTVQFSSEGTLDPDGDGISYTWDFKDGSNSTDQNPSHTYTANGKYDVTLTVSDGEKTTTATTQVTVGNQLPTGVINTPTVGTTYDAGDTISFSGSATDPEDGELPASAYSWKVVFHHLEHTHPYINEINGVKNGTFEIGRDESNEHSTWYRIYLTVTDSGGLQHTTYREIFPNLVNLTIQSSIPGGRFTVNGNLYTEPYIRQEVVGVDHGVSVESPQTINNSTYRFRSWSDEGAQTHVYRVPDTDSTLTVNLFEALPVPSPWNNTDIGDPTLSGKANYDSQNNAFIVDGGGDDIWQTKDEFHYAYQSLDGDGEIIARVTSQSPADAWTKSGIMFKESPTAGSSYTMVSVTPANGIVMQYNFTGNAGPRPTYNFPIWLKLKREGNVFTSYYSQNGTNWAQLGQATVSMNTAATVGMFVTAHTDSALSTTVFDNVTVTNTPDTENTAPTATNQSISTEMNTPINITLSATDPTNDPLTYTIVSNPIHGTLSGTAPNVTYTPNTGYVGSDSFTFKANDGQLDSNTATVTISVTPQQGTLPTEWRHQDIGDVGKTGSTTYADGVFTLQGAGYDIWGTHDDFHFAYQPLDGDGEIVARVTSQTNTNGWAKAGVMIKESTSFGTNYSMLAVTPENGYAMQSNFNSSTQGGTYTFPNAWVKLKRTGNTFTTYKSTDGTNWTMVGEKTLAINNNALIGLFVNSHSHGNLSTVTFDNVTITDSSTPNTPPTALDKDIHTDKDTSVNITLTANDGENDPLTYTIVTPPRNGTLSGTVPNAIYTPNNGYVGSDSFTFKANDGIEDSNIATISIDIHSPEGSLPSEWKTSNIGDAQPAGSANYDSTSKTYTLNGGGEDIWQTADQFYYAYQNLTGDGEIVARITSQTNTDPWAKAGVMIKNSATKGASYALMGITPENGYTFQNNFIWHTSGSSYTLPNAWVKLKRSGNIFTGYTSSDGLEWIQVGQANLTMNNTVTIGLFSTSHNSSQLSTVTFDNVSLTGSNVPGNTAPTATDQNITTDKDTPVSITLTANDGEGSPLTYSISSLPAHGTLSGTAPNVTYTPNTGYVGSDSFTFKANDGQLDSNTATVSLSIIPTGSTLPTEWQDSDIGHITPEPGSANYDATTQTYTITGGGHDIWDTHDDFHFAYQPLDGDGEIVVRVTSQTNTNNSAKAGIMIKESTTPFSPYTMIAITPGNGYKMQWTFLKQSISGGNYTLPNAWMKLKRSGNTFTAYVSNDGNTWTQIGEKTVEMNSNAFVGLFTTSHNSGAVSTATFDNVTINKTINEGQDPLPLEWQTSDIGHIIPGPGSATYNNTTHTFTLTGGGHDIWDAHDDFRFAYQPLDGDGEIIARVTSQTNTNGHAKAGVMIKESTTPFTPYTFIGITPENGYKMQWTFLLQSISGGTYTFPNAWVKLKRTGNTFTTYKSTDGTNWTMVGEKTLAINNNALIGLFATSHDSGELSTATFDNVTVTP